MEQSTGRLSPAIEFDAKAKAAVEAHDTAALAQPQKWGETLRNPAHRAIEHYLPLLCCIGSTDPRQAVSYPYEGFDFGTILVRAVLFGESPGS